MGVASNFVAAVTDGPLLIAAPVAAAAGLVSFLSPCCLPLVPGYLSYVTGLSGADMAGAAAVGAREPVPQTADVAPAASAAPAGPVPPPTRPPHGRSNRRALAGSVLFVLGFSSVFVAGGALFGGLGQLLDEHQRPVQIGLGALTVVMGMSFLGLGLVPGLERDIRLRRLPRGGLAGAPLLGVVFGVGWTPCLGPTLAAVQSLAYTQASAGRGALLTCAYCAGLGVPFVLTGLAFGRALTVFALVRRHHQAVMRAGGIMLVAVGLLLVTGIWEQLGAQMREWTAGFGTAL